MELDLSKMEQVITLIVYDGTRKRDMEWFVVPGMVCSEIKLFEISHGEGC